MHVMDILSSGNYSVFLYCQFWVDLVLYLVHQIQASYITSLTVSVFMMSRDELFVHRYARSSLSISHSHSLTLFLLSPHPGHISLSLSLSVSVSVSLSIYIYIYISLPFSPSPSPSPSPSASHVLKNNLVSWKSTFISGNNQDISNFWHGHSKTIWGSPTSYPWPSDNTGLEPLGFVPITSEKCPNECLNKISIIVFREELGCSNPIHR